MCSSDLNTLGQATVTMTSNIAGQHNVVVSRKTQPSDNKTFSLSVLPDESSAKVISITGAEKTITVGENITRPGRVSVVVRLT